jgi:hypothetical protein
LGLNQIQTTDNEKNETVRHLPFSSQPEKKRNGFGISDQGQDNNKETAKPKPKFQKKNQTK